jgi:hypothetical protein
LNNILTVFQPVDPQLVCTSSPKKVKKGKPWNDVEKGSDYMQIDARRSGTTEEARTSKRVTATSGSLRRAGSSVRGGMWAALPSTCSLPWTCVQDEPPPLIFSIVKHWEAQVQEREGSVRVHQKGEG